MSRGGGHESEDSKVRTFDKRPSLSGDQVNTHYKNLLHNIDGGPILHKLKHPPLSLDEVDPKFFSAYDKSKHGAQLKKDLNLSHLEPAVRDQINTLVDKFCPSQELRVYH